MLLVLDPGLGMKRTSSLACEIWNVKKTRIRTGQAIKFQRLNNIHDLGGK